MVNVKQVRSFAAWLAVLAAAALLPAASAHGAAPALAATAEANAVERLVGDLAPGGVAGAGDIAPPAVAGGGELELGDGQFSLAADGEGAVEIADAGFALGLPVEARAEDAERSRRGLVVYPAADAGGTAVAVEATSQSLRVLTVVGSADGSRRYTYSVAGATPVLGDDGGVQLWRDAGLVGLIETPWAVDAGGNDVRTWFEISDGAVVQIVDFDEQTAFPVLADPSAIWWATTAAKCLIEIANPVKLADFRKRAAAAAALQKAITALGGPAKALSAFVQYVLDKRRLTVKQQTQVKNMVKAGLRTAFAGAKMASCGDLAAAVATELM